jgi:hypothetical protein
MKKVIAKLSATLEAILRHRDTFNRKGDPNNQKDKEILDKNVKIETDKLAAILKELFPHLETVEKSEFKDRYLGFREILQEAEKEFKNKEDLTDYCFKLK